MTMSSEDFHLRELTPLEEQYLQQRRASHRENITKKQVVMNKEFKGSSFLSDPPVILFQDFEVGRIYKKKFTLTNVSWSFNTFKVLPLDDEIRNFFDIKYKLPGKMSAGMACEITITFSPRLNQDIFSELPILAQTGPVSIPLRCHTKKVEVSIETPKGSDKTTIDFGAVNLAESKTLELKLSNHGALKTSFQISGHEMIALEQTEEFENTDDSSDTKVPQDEIKDKNDILTFSKLSCELAAHSEVIVNVTLAPKDTVAIHSQITLRFEDEYTKDFHLTVVGTGQNPPVYLEQDELNFRTCYFRTLYRDTLLVHNRGKTATKVICKLGKQYAFLKEHLKFVPDMGYVQADTPLRIQLLFHPQMGLLSDERVKDIVDGGVATIDIPIRVQVPDQVMPVSFKFKALVASSQLSIDPPEIIFGDVSLEETVSAAVTIKNHSILPQEFGFVTVPKEIRILPNEGFSSILPGETLTFDILFTPSAAVDYALQLRCRNLRSEDSIIQCTARGVKSPIRLSAPVIQLSSAGQGDFVEETVIVENVDAKRPQVFRFLIPANSNLEIEPNQGILVPRGSRGINIKFIAPRIKKVTRDPEEELSADETNAKWTSKKQLANKSTKKPSKSSKKSTIQPPPEPESELLLPRDYEERDEDSDEKPAIAIGRQEPSIQHEAGEDFYNTWQCSKSNSEPWSHHKTFAIPMFIKDYPLKCIPLEVQATVINPTLLLLDDADNNVDVIHFGNAAIFQRTRKSLRIKNVGRVTTTISVAAEMMSELEDNAYFLTNLPVDEMHPGEECDFMVEFYPIVPREYNYNVIFQSSNTNNVQLPLRGVALDPILTISPNDVTGLHLGNVVVHGQSVAGREILLSNHSSVEISYSIVFPEEDIHPRNRDGSNPFTATPSNGVIEKNGTCTVKLCFQPDHEFEFYRAICAVQYGGSQNQRFIGLRGSGWNPGVFIEFETDSELDKKKRDYSFLKSEMERFAEASKDQRAAVVKGSQNHTDVFQMELSTVRRFLTENAPTEDQFQLIRQSETQESKGQKTSKTNGGSLDHTFHNVKVGDTEEFVFALGLAADTKISGNAVAEFTFTPLTERDRIMHGFSVEPLKGTISAGQTVRITVRFSPVEKTKALVPIPNIPVWVESRLQCTVKDSITSSTRVLSFDMRGTSYQGDEKNGRMEGKGRFAFKNGIVYEGAMLDGMFHGFGVIHFPGGGRLEGTFEKDVLLPGQGTYFFKDNLEYKTENWDYCLREDVEIKAEDREHVPDRRFYTEMCAAWKQPEQKVESDPNDGRPMYSAFSADGIRPNVPSL